MNKVKRKFVFIDESGDPGFSGNASSSVFFQINIVTIDDNALSAIDREVSTYKYFLDHYKELKTKTNIKNDKIRNLVEKITGIGGVKFFCSSVNKKTYKGPYKNDTVSFRNFVIKRTLQGIDCIAKEKNTEIELVIDRYIDSIEQEENLKKYLNDGYGLPRFLHINQVDSRYCYPIQILDVFGLFYRKNKFNKIDGFEFVDLKIGDT